MEYYTLRRDAMLSFRNNEKLNDTQIKFITNISNEVYEHTHYINDYYKQMKLSKSQDAIKQIKNEYFVNFVKKYFAQQGDHNTWYIKPHIIFNDSLVNILKFNDKAEYLTFIKRIKECYNQKLINKEHYISLLSDLLYCNTYYIVDYLNEKTISWNTIRSQSDWLYTVRNFATELIITFRRDIVEQFYKDRSITDFVNSCIYCGLKNCYTKIDVKELKKNNNYYELYRTEIQDALTYENYKDIINNIILDLIPLLMQRKQEVFSAEQIIEPIKLGIYCHAFKSVYIKHTIDGRIFYKKGLLAVDSPVECYKNILSSPKAIEQIDKEFNITKLINRYWDIVTYHKFIYDKTNDWKKNGIPFGSFNLFREKVKTLDNNSKLQDDKRMPYRHSQELLDTVNRVNDKKVVKTFGLIEGIMKYLPGTTISEAMQEHYKQKTINNNATQNNNINEINEINENDNTINTSITSNQNNNINEINETDNMTNISITSNQNNNINEIHDTDNTINTSITSNQNSNINKINEIDNITNTSINGNQNSNINKINEPNHTTNISNN